MARPLFARALDGGNGASQYNFMLEHSKTFAPVGAAEAGQKLLRFLQRRLHLPESLLHRWVRTGQVRLNGRRCKPYETVHESDQVRVPPFACQLAANGALPDPPPESGSDLPPLLAAHDGIWAFAKPAGLAVHPGTGTSASLSELLAAHYADYFFKPAPAHRLDKETSGVILVGATFQAMRDLQKWFGTCRVRKEYLAWVKGRWPYGENRILRHFVGGMDKIEARENLFRGSRKAVCLVRLIRATPEKSLLQIRLITGRKRQIRAQLAATGFPIFGDSRYGAHKGAELKLHACRVGLPNGLEFSCLPSWTGEFAVKELPEFIKCGSPAKQASDI